MVNGEIRKMPPNKVIHADTVENLADLLKSRLDRRTVQVRVSTFGLVIRHEPVTTRVPDIAVFIRSNVVEVDGHIQSVPDLVVERSSPPPTRDRSGPKSCGITRAWVFPKCGLFLPRRKASKSCS